MQPSEHTYTHMRALGGLNRSTKTAAGICNTSSSTLEMHPVPKKQQKVQL
jgi:hypothetical protein